MPTLRRLRVARRRLTENRCIMRCSQCTQRVVLTRSTPLSRMSKPLFCIRSARDCQSRDSTKQPRRLRPKEPYLRMPQFAEQEPPSGSPARKVSERAAATCVRFRPAARLWGVRKKMRLSAGPMLRGLRALEGNGLVRFVKEGRGQCPVMEIVDRLPHGDLKP